MTTSPPLPWHRPLTFLAAACGVFALVAGAAAFVDSREIAGAAVWLKPFKFAVSLGVYALTLAWLLRFCRRARRTGRWAGTVVAVATAAELALIAVQGARGVPSHFNNATAFDAAVWSAMGALVMILWMGSAVVAVVVALQRDVDVVVRSAARIGFLVSLAGMGLAFMMTSPTAAQQAEIDGGTTPAIIGAHSVGVTDGGPGMPVTGWSTTGGDLRVPHFAGIHALQALPLLALALAVLARRDPGGRFAAVRARLWTVRVAGAGYAGLVGLLTWQALRGQPVIHPDRWTLLAAAALAAAVTLGAAVASRLRDPLPARAPGLVRH